MRTILVNDCSDDNIKVIVPITATSHYVVEF